MRTLFISNFFPPLHRGGYEEWCQEVAVRFLDAGHPVRVLTSRYQIDQVHSDPPYVYRQLNLEMEMASLSNGLKFFTHRKRRINQSLELLKHHIDEFKPDAILCWGMWNFPFDIPAAAERLLPGRVAYYLGDYWPTLPPQFRNYWEAEPSGALTAIPKRLLALPAKFILDRETRPTLALEHGLFCSQYMSQNLASQQVKFKNSEVVYGGIDTAPYVPATPSNDDDESIRPLQLLFIGRIIADKGVMTILEALKILIQEYDQSDFHLNIVGEGPADYTAGLQSFIQSEGLMYNVTFVGGVPKDQVPNTFQQSDIFIFASQWPEPFGRVIVEAMASGVAVVATAVGGAAEIVEDGINALTFQPDNAAQLAQNLDRLMRDQALRSSLVENGLQNAQRFDVGRMANELISALTSLNTD